MTPNRLSVRAALGAGLYLIAVPVGLAMQAATGANIETVVHWGFAFGAGFIATAVADFRTTRLMRVLGTACIGILAAIFGLQGISDLTGTAAIRHVAFDILGQNLEGWMLNGFIAWCGAAVVASLRDRPRGFGIASVSVGAAARIYAMLLPWLDSTAPLPTAVKLLYFLPFVWLFIAAMRRTVPA